ncbi:cysteine--tRNA ligase [Polynucleobacter sp. IMCC30063]|uniref:cysteine--tRNA ligase n=1 Tax=Polynucleobacter sp. IMCC30063 TaxID=2907298 RepID=UPI001F002E0F|nr:cysteine--tRNA ligase [Polynucleobacter sp. IMCC30063]MCE7506203.1 cysteine--tRNA ligase [Polynucleobacter sp. IMCC30063]
MLQIYNTLSRSKEVFKPITPRHVSIYVCGMTVYDYCHLGHARVMIVFDIVVRWLMTLGYEVNYVRNITDIDDKIIQRALENKESILALTNRFITAMHVDSDHLGLLQPNHEPRATDFIAPMQGMISRLIDQQLAYQGDDGDINFSVRSFPKYGQLSGKAIDDLNAGERVAIGSGKRDPLDFVLWKSAKPEEPSDTRWKSPWGEGRPGWHIECSAMSCDLLGQHFDIHGGGADLQFPHHENEIAQSEGAIYGQNRKPLDPPFVNYWMHNGHIRVNKEKMSKSLGNFFLIRDVLEQFDPEVIRFFMLKAHYRSPINFSDSQLEEARAGLNRLYTALVQTPGFVAKKMNGLGDPANAWVMRFTAAMNDDFNTPEALAVLFDLASEINRAQGAERVILAQHLHHLAGVLNFLQGDPTAFLQGETLVQQNPDSAGLSAELIETQIAARSAAKVARDFTQADTIRQRLLAQGIVLEDQAGGVTTWRRA